MKMEVKSDKAEYDHTSSDVIYSSLNGSVFIKKQQDKGGERYHLLTELSAHQDVSITL